MTAVDQGRTLFAALGTAYGSGFSYNQLTGAVTEAAGTTLVMSPTVTVCSACHNTADAISHFKINGAAYYQTRSSAITGTNETCLICHGTGRIAELLSGSSRTVTGLDNSPEMLRLAREKLKPLTGRVGLALGDALNAPFPPASFDVITIAFGMRNLPDYRRGFAEMARSVRPGGRVPPKGGARAPRTATVPATRTTGAP